MATAKRLYLYLVSALGLGMLSYGSVGMLGLLLDRIGLKPASSSGSIYNSILRSSNVDKETLSLSIALIVVGLTLWIIHWALVERTVMDATPEAAAERSSIVRSVYFSTAMAITLAIGAALVAMTLSDWLGNIVDSRRGTNLNYSSTISIGTVALAIWGYHAWIRDRDIKAGQIIRGAAAWFSRFYLYGAVAAGIAVMISGAQTLIQIIGIQAAEPSSLTSYSGGAMYTRAELSSLVVIGVGAAIWASHWIYSNRICTSDGEQGFLERVSKVRFAMMAYIVYLGVSAVLSGFTSSINSLVDAILSLTHNTLPLWYLVMFPILAAGPAAGAWWWYRRRALAEGASTPTPFSPLRIVDYVTAAVGITAIAAGAFSALSTIFGQWFAPNPFSSFDSSFNYGSMYDTVWKMALVSAASMIAVGVAIWVIPWMASQRRRNTDHIAETTSSSRGFYLYGVSGIAIISGAIGAAILIVLYVRLAVGLSDPRLGSEVSSPLAFVLVGAALAGYHLWTLRDDPNPPVAPAIPAMPVVAPAAPVDASPAPAAPVAPNAAPAADAGSAPADAAPAPAKKPRAKSKPAE